MSRTVRKCLTVFLTIAISICMAPYLGSMTDRGQGAWEAYAAEAISGEVNASELTTMGEYNLTGDATIYVDSDMIIGSINVGGHTLTIEGNGEDILSIYGKGIEGSSGNVVLNSGKLDLDNGGGTGNWVACVDLNQGSFTMNGGGLFMIYSGQGAYSSAGISAASFKMNGGVGNITSSTSNTGSAIGIQTNDFTMTGGDLSVDAKTTVAGQSASGIEASGATSDADFHMSGGTLGVTASAGGEAYGINWTADRSKNSFVIDGGVLSAKGNSCGIRSWVPVTISGGADVTAKSTDYAALITDQATIGISGIGTKVTATSANADAIDAQTGTIDLGTGIKIVQPEGGYVADYGTNSQSIKDASDQWAKSVVIEGVAIPTELSITYDATKAFPTTRLTGHQVSLHLLRNVTTNPGKSTDGNGWYVFGADPEKTDFEASPYTCLVRKTGSGYETLENSDEVLDPADEYYFCFNIEDDGTRPFDPNRTYTVTVNAEPADEVVNYVDENGGGQLYVYKKVDLDEVHNVAWSTRVSPQGAKVTKGSSRQFSAEVYGATDDSVTWSLSENGSTGTYITSDGKLYAASDESKSSVKVTATSVADNSISDSVYVEVVDYEPTIDSVGLTADSNPVCRGAGVWLHAEVEGTDIHDLKWEVIGSDGKSYFSQGSNLERLLLVGQAETASELTVKATSVADPTKYDTVTLRIKDKDIIKAPLDLTFDGSGLSLTDEAGNLKTGKQVTKEFRNTISSPYGQSLTNKDAPGGWYVFGEDRSSEPTSQYTSLVRKSDGNNFDETLYQSTESLSAEGEYYLWFNVEDCESTHQFDYDMDLAANITVNGMPVNGETVIAKWGGEINVYLRIVEEPGWVYAGENWYYYESNTSFATDKWMKKDGEWAYLGADGRAEFKRRDIADATVTGISDKKYTGNAITQSPVVKIDGETLVENTDYEVAYKNNTEAGTATVTVTGIGIYEGTKNVKFKITAGKVTPVVTLKTNEYTYNGKARKPAVTVTDGSKTLVKDTDYTVTYKNNKNVGKASVVVTMKGNYSGTKTVTFKINPKGTTLKAPSKYVRGKKYLTVKWNKQAAKMSTSRITGYQILLATNSKFTKNKKTVNVKGYSKVSKKVTGLKSGKKYYIKIRTYKTVSGTKYYSPWSKVKTVKTK